MKICSHCKLSFDESNFHKNKSCKDGFADQCKDCKKKSDRAVYLKKNKEHIRKLRQEYRKKHKEHLNKIAAERLRIKRKEEPEKYKKWNRNKYIKLISDPIKKLKERRRSRRSEILSQNRNYSGSSTMKDLGCDLKTWKQYIENKFHNHPISNKVMSWEDYGPLRMALR